MRKITFISTLLLLSNGLFAQNMVHYADSIRRTNNIPELAFAVVSGDSILEMAFLGHHAVNLKDTAAITDRFHIGSNTKAMTGFIAAKVVEENKINWDTKFFDVFPEWQRKCDTAYFNITLADLLSHRARIRPFTDDNDYISIPLFKGDKDERRMGFAKWVLTLKPLITDTSVHYTYSNAGYVLAALMIEKVTGRTWEQLVNICFNQNLQINTQLSWPDNQTKKDTWGHWIVADTLAPVPSNVKYTMAYQEPADDINVTLPDYIKFIQLNIQGLKGKDNYLKSSTYNYIHKGINEYSIGWINLYERGMEFSNHSGSEGTYFSTVSIDRQKGIAYIIFTNTATEDAVTGIRFLLKDLKVKYGSW
jgi:CubicO group peptidase (beta-lactamase class C family)